MARLKDKIAVACTVAALGAGTLYYFAPDKTAQERHQMIVERSSGDLADVEESNRDGNKDAGDDARNAENDQKHVPHEPRPKLPGPWRSLP